MSKRLGLLLAWLGFTGVCFATTPLQASLEEMAESADHILVGKVIGVDAIDSNGRILNGLGVMTGPGLGNTIRLVIEIQEVIVSAATSVPNVIRVPLDPDMHYNLGQVAAVESESTEPFLLLLKGTDFEPIFPGVFGRSLEDRKEAIELHKKYHQESGST